MDKSIRFRVPIWMFAAFKRWCDERNTSMSQELRRHIHGLVADRSDD